MGQEGPRPSGRLALLLLGWAFSRASAAALRAPHRTTLRALRASAASLASGFAEPALDAASSAASSELIAFVPSFRAAQHARAVVYHPLPTATDASYNVSIPVPRAEVTAMLHGLVGTEQFDAATKLLRAHLARGQGRKRLADERLASIVLNRCADRGQMDICERVVNVMRARSVPVGKLTFCILIKGHGRAGNVGKAARTYELMRSQHVEPDLATLNALLDAYATNGRMPEAEDALEKMRAEGFDASVRSYNTLVKGYARLGELQAAFALVRHMRRPPAAAQPNEVTYNTLLSALVSRRRLSRAHWVLSGMRKRRGLKADVWSYTTLVRGLVQEPTAPLEPAIALLRQMRADGVRPNAVTATTLLTACFDRGNATAARYVAAELERFALDDGPALRHAAECAFIVGLCRPRADALGEVARSRAMVAEALRRFGQLTSDGGGGTWRPPVRVCNALLAALTAAEMDGSMEGAQKVFALMRSGAAAPPDRYSLSLMLGGYARSRQIEDAYPIWAQLERRGSADVVALNCWLQVCVRSGHLRLALQSFQSVKSNSKALARSLDLVTFATLINALVASGLPAADARALRLWAEMRRAEIAPDPALVSAMLRACRSSLGVEVALRIRDDLISIGWSRRQLAPHDAVISGMLPSLAQIMEEPQKWAVLGVRADSTLTSEAGTLLALCAKVGRERANRPSRDAAEALGGEQREGRSRGQGTRSQTQFEASPSSEEIFERKGWNKMDGSWRPF